MRPVHLFAVIALIVAISLAGCYYPEAPSHSVGYRGSLGTENGTFEMNGTVTVSGGASPDRTYRPVNVVLYDEERQLIDAASVGLLSTQNDTRLHVELRSDVIPTYVVVESPDFWSGEDLRTVSYRLEDGAYTEYWRTEPKEKFDDGFF